MNDFSKFELNTYGTNENNIEVRPNLRKPVVIPQLFERRYTAKILKFIISFKMN
jgi:hypothetical protein